MSDRAAQPVPVDPSLELLRLRGQVGLLRRELEQARTRTNPVLSGGAGPGQEPASREEALRSLTSRQIEIQTDLERTTATLQALQESKAAGMENLREAILRSRSDSLLADLSEQLAAAEEALKAAQSQRKLEPAELQTRQAQLEDLYRKLDERTEGVLIGLTVKAASEKNVLEQLQSEAQRIRENVQ